MRADEEELNIYPLINLRVQYMVDADPFNSLSVYPLPSRAPVFSFVSTTPLATQLGALLRLLGAPQRVSISRSIFYILKMDLLANSLWASGFQEWFCL